MFIRSCILFLSLLLTAGPIWAEEVKDHAGRLVNVPDSPGRVVSLAPSITEMVFAVGCGGLLVGVTQFSNYPQEAQKIPSVGSYVSLDIEKIVSLNPDLCIAVKDGNPIGVVRRLEELGIPVYALDPRDLASVMNTIKEIGSLLGAEDKAKRVVEDMEERLAEVDKKLSDISRRPGVFFQIGINPIISAGSDTFIHELITRAGGKNLSGEYKGYPKFSTEEVLALAPEIIIVTSMNRQNAFRRVVKEWKQWKNLPAAANDRIYLVNSDLVDRPSPRLVKGLEELAGLIHPGRFNETGRN
ncbi:MAG: cobalamin-binding protein [Desulfobacteraceae bacterium]|nr:cobalamin-binding protein [Desulfobacteraceae bacterium]